MIGRAALGNPWIFSQIAHELATGTPAPQPTAYERAEACLRQAILTLQTSKLPERQVLLELRGQLAKYADGLPDEAELRASIVRAESLADIERALAPILMGVAG
jgi:tRNA-dihydrouridine synthase